MDRLPDCRGDAFGVLVGGIRGAEDIVRNDEITALPGRRDAVG
jgi:hypothetical protein